MLDIEGLKSHSYDVIGAIHAVHKELGPGLYENIYQEGLMMELSDRNIPFEKEFSFHPLYRGVKMNVSYRLDFLVKGDIIIELKSVDEGLCVEHKKQLFNYMRLCQASVGILVNFYPSFAEIERYFFGKDHQEIYGTDGLPIKNFNKLLI